MYLVSRLQTGRMAGEEGMGTEMGGLWVKAGGPHCGGPWLQAEWGLQTGGAIGHCAELFHLTSGLYLLSPSPPCSALGRLTTWTMADGCPCPPASGWEPRGGLAGGGSREEARLDYLHPWIPSWAGGIPPAGPRLASDSPSTQLLRARTLMVAGHGLCAFPVGAHAHSCLCT